jgi:hypothetical protein
VSTNDKLTMRPFHQHICEQNSFTGTTPIGDIVFTNLIATFDNEAPTKLVLAAHHDSKHFDTYPANQVSSETVPYRLQAFHRSYPSPIVYWSNRLGGSLCNTFGCRGSPDPVIGTETSADRNRRL